MLFERIVSRVPGVEGQMTIGACDPIRCVVGGVVIPASGSELFSAREASGDVERPNITKGLASTCDHGLASGVLFGACWVAMTESDVGDDGEATRGRMSQMLVSGYICLFPSIELAVAGEALDVVWAGRGGPPNETGICQVLGARRGERPCGFYSGCCLL
jgi:hypothetical protein